MTATPLELEALRLLDRHRTLTIAQLQHRLRVSLFAAERVAAALVARGLVTRHRVGIPQ